MTRERHFGTLESWATPQNIIGALGASVLKNTNFYSFYRLLCCPLRTPVASHLLQRSLIADLGPLAFHHRENPRHSTEILLVILKLRGGQP